MITIRFGALWISCRQVYTTDCLISHAHKGGTDTAKVTREMVEKAGVDVNHHVELLVKNASAELTTFYYYTILRLNLIGLEGEGIKEIADRPDRGPEPL